MRNIYFKVKSTPYCMDKDTYSYYKDLILKADKSEDENAFIERLSDLVSLFNKTLKHTAYIETTQYNTVDVGCVIERPEPLFLCEAVNDNGIITASFSIPMEVYEDDFSEFHEFVDWYINHYSSLFKRITAKHFGCRAIQPHNVRPEWELKGHSLFVGLKYKVVFQ